MSVNNDVFSQMTIDDQNVLLVLAVIGRPLKPTELKQMLTALGWRMDGKEASLVSLLHKAWTERMVALGTIEIIAGIEIGVEAGVGETLVRRAHADTYRGIYSIYQMRYHRFGHDEKPQEALRNAFNLGEVNMLFHYARQKPFSYTWSEELCECLEGAVTSWDERWFLTLPPAVQWQILGYVQSMAFMGLEDVRPFLPAMKACAEKSKEHAGEFLGLYAIGRFLAGEEVALDTLDVASSSWLSSAAGFIAFATNKPKAAVGYFLHARKLRKREHGARLESLDDPFVLFHQLALLQLADPASLELVSALQKSDDRYAAAPERELVVDAAARLLMRRTSTPQVPAETLGAIDTLVVASYRRWFDIEMSAEQLEAVKAIREDLEGYGLTWHVTQYDLLLATGEAPESSYTSIVHLVKPVPQWQMSLNALVGMGGNDDDTGNTKLNNESRLAWFLDDDFQLEPREQKRNKAGWSKGRKVSLMRLLKERESFDYLTAADKRICACIEVDKIYDRYGYDKDNAILNAQALSSAVGHPAIFWPEELREPVEVRDVPPELVVLEEGDQLHLSLTPRVSDQEQRQVVERRGFNQLDVTTLTDQHLQIAVILGADGLRVPLTAKDQVLQSISAIAPLLTVQSDIDGDIDDTAELVDCDPRLHIQIQPAEEGLRMGAFIRPFGERGPLFTPGVGGLNVISEIDSKRLRSSRDLAAERNALAELVEKVPVFKLQEGSDWVLDNPSLALEALDGLRDYPEELVLSWPQGRSMSLLGHSSVGSMSFNISSQREWFAVDGEIVFDEDNVMSLQRVLELVRQSDGRFLKIGESEFLALSANLHKKLQSLADFSDDDGKFHPLASGVVAELTQDMLGESSPEWDIQQSKLHSAKELEPELPEGLDAELRDYQRAGYDWLTRLAHWGGGACLADDMGLGKTVQILSVLLARASQGPQLVLAPTSVCGNWLIEAARFTPSLKTHRFGEGDREEMIDKLGPNDIVVSSYGLMQSESTLLTPVRWATLVADEAQALKNPRALRSKAAAALSADFRIIATGTPIENHLGELWSLFQIINPGLLGSQKRFERQFIGPMDRGDEHATKRLRALVAPFILRRHKSQVLTELPSRTEVNRVIEASDEEKVFYEALRRQALEDLADTPEDLGKQRFKVLAEITRLRRACCHPKLVSPAVSIEGSKLNELKSIVAELVENDHRALIFSQFVDHLKLIREALDAAGFSYQYLDGSTTVAKRQEAVDDFQAGKGDVFLISLKAGGSGLNLTAADYVIHMDPWWNPAVEDQASDRAHRMGQLRPVTIYRLIMAGSIEEKILSLHQQKRELADSLLEGRDVASTVDIDDMIALLNDGM